MHDHFLMLLSICSSSQSFLASASNGLYFLSLAFAAFHLLRLANGLLRAGRQTDFEFCHVLMWLGMARMFGPFLAFVPDLFFGLVFAVVSAYLALKLLQSTESHLLPLEFLHVLMGLSMVLMFVPLMSGAVLLSQVLGAFSAAYATVYAVAFARIACAPGFFRQRLGALAVTMLSYVSQISMALAMLLMFLAPLTMQAASSGAEQAPGQQQHHHHHHHHH